MYVCVCEKPMWNPPEPGGSEHPPENSASLRGSVGTPGTRRGCPGNHTATRHRTILHHKMRGLCFQDVIGYRIPQRIAHIVRPLLIEWEHIMIFHSGDGWFLGVPDFETPYQDVARLAALLMLARGFILRSCHCQTRWWYRPGDPVANAEEPWRMQTFGKRDLAAKWTFINSKNQNYRSVNRSWKPVHNLRCNGALKFQLRK